MIGSTSSNEVEVRRIVDIVEDGISITYRMRRTEAGSAQIRLFETLPRSVPPSAVACDAPDDGRWESYSAQRWVFVGEVSGASPTQATLDIQSTTADPKDCRMSIQVLPECPDGDPKQNGDAGPVMPQPATQGTPTAVSGSDGGSQRQPAVGLVATGENLETVARATHRATAHGLSVFIAADANHEIVTHVTKQLDARVVEIEMDGTSDDDVAATLTSLAQSESHPGLLFRNGRTGKIDFDKSLDAFESSADPITTPVLEPEATSVLVGIPAYNEAETVGRVVTEAKEYGDEVLVVDDGSDDETAARARDAAATVVEHDGNRGYGQTLQTLFVEADRRDADVLVTLDADGQHDPSDIARLVETHRESAADVVIGNRFGESSDSDVPLYRRFGLHVITILTNFSIDGVGRESRIRDPQSGFRAYDGAVLTELAQNTDRIDSSMSASLDVLSFVSERGFTATEVPISISYEVENASTRNPVAHGMNLVNNIRKTLQRKRPFAVLGMPGMVLMVLGVGLSHWAIASYLSSQTMHIELTLLSAVLIILGLFSSLLSIVRHSLNTHIEAAPLSD